MGMGMGMGTGMDRGGLRFKRFFFEKKNQKTFVV
jgi:hypothetical protein